MIIDIHTHAFPSKIRKNRKDFFYDSEFRLLYDNSKSKMASIQDIIESMDKNKIDKSVVFGFPWTCSEAIKINNDYIVEGVIKYPDRLTGFFCASPFNDRFDDMAYKYISAGLLGAGELAFYESGIDDDVIERLKGVMYICKNLPVMIHTNEPVGHFYPGKTPNTLKQIYDLVSSFPENKIILAHWGGGIFFFNLLKKEVKQKLKNIYFDTAASPFLYDNKIYKYAADLAGIDKILFGTDFPLIKPSRYFEEIKNLGLSAADEEKIMGENAKKLFG